MNNALQGQAVYVVDGTRTPFLKMRSVPGPFTAADLAVAAVQDLCKRHGVTAECIDELILGCVMPSPYEANIARLVGLRAGCRESMPAWTVQRNCASGMQALDAAVDSIRLGRHQVVLAGGTEAMTHAPLLYSPKMVAWFGQWQRIKSLPQKLQHLSKLRPGFLKPVVALLCGLTDPIVGLNMGQTAQILAHDFSIERAAMDAFAMQSHLRLAQAMAQNTCGPMTPLISQAGQIFTEDDGVRADSHMAQLARLKPVFDRPCGAITAGNSSQISDGACVLLLASESAIERYKWPVLGRIVDSHWAGLAPSRMGLGPVMAMTPLLKRHHLTPADINYWEINEAFAAQVLACVAAWSSDSFCQEHLACPQAFGAIPPEYLNSGGGAIAMGHPIGASGARIVLQCLHTLGRNDQSRGMASLCIGGGQGGAMLLERC